MREVPWIHGESGVREADSFREGPAAGHTEVQVIRASIVAPGGPLHTGDNKERGAEPQVDGLLVPASGVGARRVGPGGSGGVSDLLGAVGGGNGTVGPAY